jgi:sugar lactone lactonase YvrE
MTSHWSAAYFNISLMEIKDSIKNGERLPVEADVPPEFQNLITLCWHDNPKRRPSFAEILEKLADPYGATMSSKAFSIGMSTKASKRPTTGKYYPKRQGVYQRMFIVTLAFFLLVLIAAGVAIYVLVDSNKSAVLDPLEIISTTTVLLIAPQTSSTPIIPYGPSSSIAPLTSNPFVIPTASIDIQTSNLHVTSTFSFAKSFYADANVTTTSYHSSKIVQETAVTTSTSAQVVESETSSHSTLDPTTFQTISATLSSFATNELDATTTTSESASAPTSSVSASESADSSSTIASSAINELGDTTTTSESAPASSSAPAPESATESATESASESASESAASWSSPDPSSSQTESAPSSSASAENVTSNVSTIASSTINELSTIASSTINELGATTTTSKSAPTSSAFTSASTSSLFTSAVSSSAPFTSSSTSQYAPSPTPSAINEAYTVSTIAGSSVGYNDGQGTSALFYNPAGIALDSSGNLYVADTFNNRIRKISPSGAVSTIAGSGGQGFSDGQGTSAMFTYPWGIAVDSNGNLYVVDTFNHKIRKISPSGSVSTFAGSSSGYSDGQGTSALFSYPQGIAVDSSGNVYVADSFNHKIRKITSSGSVSTIAGSGQGSSDGEGTSAMFNTPQGIAVDSARNLYVVDTYNHRIRKISIFGTVSTIAGSGYGYSDGQGTSAMFTYPFGIAVDSTGNLFVADRNNYKIRKISPSGNVVTIAGSSGGFSDGQGSSAKFYGPVGIVVNSIGNLYVGDSDNNRVRKLTPPI